MLLNHFGINVIISVRTADIAAMPAIPKGHFTILSLWSFLCSTQSIHIKQTIRGCGQKTGPFSL